MICAAVIATIAIYAAFVTLAFARVRHLRATQRAPGGDGERDGGAQQHSGGSTANEE